MTDRELFKHALGVLDQVAGAMPFPVALQVRAALRERLEQPEQEPVAWLYEAGNDRTLHWYKPLLYGTPLYAAPPQRNPWVGLTDQEIKRMAAPLFMSHYWNLCNEFARAVEAKLREKNT